MTKYRKSIPMQSNRVLGIDPGFDRVGVAVMDKGSVLFSTCIKTSSKLPHQERLLQIGKGVGKVIERWKPQDLAIETLFFNQNTSTALKVAEARGVIIYESVRAGLNVYEYSPQAVKIGVTGYGKADKKQMEIMVRKLVKLSGDKKLDDELDAVALCINHLASKRGIW